MVIPQGAFTIVESDSPPQSIGGEAPHVHTEWLRLTLGRFLAPAELVRTHRGGLRARYLLLGEPDRDAAAGNRDLDEQLQAFDELLSSLHDDLRPLLDGDDTLEGSLRAIGLLLELTLPPASRQHAHLRAGQLQLSGWGLDAGPGDRTRPLRLRQLVGPRGASVRKQYLGDLRRALTTDAAPSAAARAPRSAEDSPATPRPRPGAPRSASRAGGNLELWMLRGVALLLAVACTLLWLRLEGRS